MFFGPGLGAGKWGLDLEYLVRLFVEVPSRGMRFCIGTTTTTNLSEITAGGGSLKVDKFTVTQSSKIWSANPLSAFAHVS